jgi:hypothetical protein
LINRYFANRIVILNNVWAKKWQRNLHKMVEHKMVEHKMAEHKMVGYKMVEYRMVEYRMVEYRMVRREKFTEAVKLL